ncbi:tetratricopeptide repeat protein [Candidatus Auribacterota bacterium]
MRIGNKVAWLSLFLFFFTGDVLAEKITWQELEFKFNQLYHQKAYNEAEKIGFEVLDIAKRSFSSNNLKIAASLRNLSLLYLDQGNYKEAERFCKEAIKVMEAGLLNKAHPYLGKTLYLMGLLCQQQKRYAYAEAFFKRAIETYEGSLGKNHPTIVSTLNDLAKLYIKQKKEGPAELIYLRILLITEMNYGPEDAKLVRALDNLARFYRTRKKYDEAEFLYKRALKIITKESFWVGDDYLKNLFEEVAILYRKMGKLKLAKKFERKTKL